ncbi:hypothetical protein [Brevundimonas vesicularis]|uniref:Uncharacterized protein n=1 Tax=Brevundimonas vesicularis TaxID=41276 RepID=A0A1Z3U553_BREVE|nr:hypothetical protein [Brevundimonas vesicularis]ASE38417.1 hypothetical protein CEP68_02235 [Brevundimonas vesicularis]
MSMLAAGLSAVGSVMGGFAKRNANRAKARALTNAAKNARQEAGIRASLALEDSDRVGARAATLAAASGGGGLQGSALAVIDDLARQGVYRARQTVRDGLTESVALLNDATTAKRQGSLDLVSGFIEAGSTVLGQMGADANARRGNGEAVSKFAAMLGGF